MEELTRYMSLPDRKKHDILDPYEISDEVWSIYADVFDGMFPANITKVI